jgi:hypothetical protein
MSDQSDQGGWQENILATEFGGAGDRESSAYGGMVDPTALQAALPARVDEHLRLIEVQCNGEAVLCWVNDVGPWSTNDRYWETGDRPRAERCFQSGQPDEFGRRLSQGAGIDLTPATMTALLVPGPPGTRQTTVRWRFATPS